MDRRLCAAFLLLAGMAGVTGCGQAISETGRPQTPDPLVVYDAPIIDRVTDQEEFPGRTEAIYTVDVRARVSGYLTDVLFKDGDSVKKGDPLFQIDPRPFEYTLERAKSTLEQAEAHAKRTNNEYHRARTLYEQGRSVSREEYDRYTFDHAEAEAALGTAKANVELAALDLEFTKVTVDLPDKPVKVIGRVGRRLVDPGNLIKADDTLMATIVSLDPMYVYFDVHEQAMLKIARLIQQGKIDPKGIPVKIALSDEQDFPHGGEVNFLDNRVDVNTGTLRFRANVNNPDHLITPGLFVRVRLPIGDEHSSLMIREQAIQSDQGQKKVFVLQAKDDQGNPYFLDRKDAKGNPIKVPAFKPVSVDIGTPGVLQNGFREVEKGIKPGDLVVAVGIQKIRVTKDPKDLSNLVKARPFNPELDSVKGSTTGGEGPPKALLGDAPAAKQHAGAAEPGAGGFPTGRDHRPTKATPLGPEAKLPEPRSGSGHRAR